MKVIIELAEKMSPTKYILTPPDELHPLVSNESGKPGKIYPDFDPWSHTAAEDEIMVNYVSKGFYTTSKVNFESISARSSIQESLSKVSDRLADQFSNVLKIREQEINKIPTESNASSAETRFSALSGPGFSLPSRITLTDQRKEQWLQELSSPYASLTKISKFLPHGLKRRQVLEQCCLRQIPLKRATWLLKCCYSLEWKALSSKQMESKEINTQLLKEWTENFIYILEKLVFEMTHHYNDSQKFKVWKTEIHYFLKLLGNCYALELMSKKIFLHWLVEFVSKVEIFEYLPLTLHILMIFWDKISIPDETKAASQPLFLVTKLSDTLLHKYLQVSHNKSMINHEKYIINDVKKNNKIKESILSIIRKLVCELLLHQSLEVFLFPASHWDIYKPCLYEITNSLDGSLDIFEDVKKKLELVSYRNESLKLNNSFRSKPIANQNVTDNSINNTDIEFIKLNSIDVELTKKLDDNPIDFDWASYVDKEIEHVSQVVQLILWAISPSKITHYEASQLVAKLLLLIINSIEGLPEYVVEDVVWSVVFQISKMSDSKKAENVSFPLLYRLLNMLINYGIVKVSTYIRKLISSGVLYLPESNDKFFHCKVLINLKISLLMKSQYNMVLRNVMEYDASYYEGYNFDLLVQKVEELKHVLFGSDLLNLEDQPSNIKIMLAEWYLSDICGGELSLVNKAILTKNFNIFCGKLDVFPLFYKWIEFIVYHQLIADIESLETLMDILLRYGKLFAQSINDHILFTKAFALIYTKVLKESDNNAYAVTSFMPFWKFFMKNFPITINFDEDFRSELGAVYEEEKTKVDILSKDKNKIQMINDSLNGNISNTKGLIWNFPEVFQTNLRIFLSSVNDDIAKKHSRYMMLLLLNANSRDYNKFISIYLKRKDFKIEDLVHLISFKLLTFEQIQNGLGLDTILTILACNSISHTQSFEYYRDQYVRANFKLLLIACQANFIEYYQLFLYIIITHGIDSKLLLTSSSVLISAFGSINMAGYNILDDLLNYGIQKSDIKIDDIGSVTDIINSSNPYNRLNFTNLWIFQAYTKYQLDIIPLNENTDLENNKGSNISEFVLSIIEVTNYSCLCAQLFDKVNVSKSIEEIMKSFEENFFERCLSSDEVSNEYLNALIEIITFLSQKIQISKSSSSSIDIMNSDDLTANNAAIVTPLISTTYLRSLKIIMEHFANMDEGRLADVKLKLDAYLKISIIHQLSIFQYFIKLIKNQKVHEISSILANMFTLFEKTSFDLSLKLMFYEILSSLKSHCLYISTTESSRGNQPFEIPEKLMNLPPFEVSSFLNEKSADEKVDTVMLGLSTASPTSTYEATVKSNPSCNSSKNNENNCSSHNRWYIYNKKQSRYWCKFYDEPYHSINNYQSESSSSFNNSSLNLSLFDSSYDKKNPK